jgi:hypothetical protein
MLRLKLSKVPLKLLDVPCYDYSEKEEDLGPLHLAGMDRHPNRPRLLGFLC